MRGGRAGADCGGPFFTGRVGEAENVPGSERPGGARSAVGQQRADQSPGT